MDKEEKKQPEVVEKIVKQEPVKREPTTAVRVIDKDASWALVEWGTPIRRAYIAPGHVENSRVKVSVLNETPLYGEDWSKLVTIAVTPESVSELWHSMGIWTEADLRQNWTAATQATYGKLKESLVSALRALGERKRNG